MPTFYIPQTGPTGGFRIGEALAAGYRDRSDLDNASQLRRIREEEAARARAQEIDAAESRRIKGIGEQLALRGQILGTVETPADYAAALPVLQGYNLPMGDLPQDRRSTASETFRRPEVAAPQIAPAWMPASWDMTQSLQNRIDLPAPVRDLPQEELALPGIAPEEVATTVQRRAQIGLPLNLQQKYQDADLGRQIQREELAKRSEKYATQLDYADRSANLADKRFALQETKDQREARLEQQRINLARQANERAAASAARDAATTTPKIPGYEPIPDATIDAASAKVARDAIGKLGSLEAIIKEFKTAYADAKKRGVGGQIIGPDADRLNGIRQRMLLNLKEAENLGVLQAVDIQTMEPIVPKAVGAGAILNSMVGRNDPLIALDQFEREVRGRLGSVVQSHGYQPIAKPSAQFKETKVYNGATYGRNSPSENWKLVK